MVDDAQGILAESRLSTVRVFARDWERTTRFYARILGLSQRLHDAELGWAEFDVGGPVLAVERVPAAEADDEGLVGRFVGISLLIADVDAAYVKLKDAGVIFTGPPTRQPWGGTLTHLEDPEGNIITLLSRQGDG